MLLPSGVNYKLTSDSSMLEFKFPRHYLAFYHLHCGFVKIFSYISIAYSVWAFFEEQFGHSG